MKFAPAKILLATALALILAACEQPRTADNSAELRGEIERLENEIGRLEFRIYQLESEVYATAEPMAADDTGDAGAVATPETPVPESGRYDLTPVD